MVEKEFYRIIKDIVRSEEYLGMKACNKNFRINISQTFLNQIKNNNIVKYNHNNKNKRTGDITMEKKNIEKTVREGLQKIEDGVVTGYKKIEDGVVEGYKKVETGAVEGFNKVNDKMIEKLFAKEGETLEEAKKRLSGESNNKEEK